jgi:hypothetical protein
MLDGRHSSAFVGIGATSSLNYWTRSDTTLWPKTNTDNITTLGNVGVGTTSPTGLLQVGNILGGTAPMTVTSNFVGIGNTAPRTVGNMFEVNGSIGIKGNINMPDGGTINNINGTSVITIQSATNGVHTLNQNWQLVSIPANTAPALFINHGAGTTNILNIRSNSAPYAFGIKADGNVGIGTTNPVGKFEVMDLTNDSGMTSGAFKVDTANNTVYFGRLSGTVGSSDNFIFRARNGNKILEVDNNSAMINIGEQADTGNTSSINLYRSGTTVMKILNDGSVGIGTTNPVSLLELSKSASGTLGPELTLTNAASGAGDQEAITFKSGTDTRSQILSTVGQNPQYSGNLEFLTKDTYAGTLQSRLFIQGHSGNIGIGTTSPAAKLAINGGLHVGGDSDPGDNNALIDGSLTITGTLDPNGSITLPTTGISGAGAGSGLNADLLDSLSSASFGQLSATQTWTGTNYFLSNKGAASYLGANNTYSLEAYSTDGGAAAMSFHRGGAYAVNFGLDPDGVMRIGGWSASSNRWQLDMSGNETIAGILTASGAGSNYFAGSVGVGISPDSRLHVQSSGNSTWPIKATNSNGQILGGWFQDSDGDAIIYGLDSAGNYDLVLRTDGSDSYFMGGGNFGIGDNTPSYQLQLSTNSAAKPTSTLWTVPSDIRIKKDITPFTDGLDVLKQINPVNYTLNGKADLPEGDKSIGIIAQEIKDIAPYTVGTWKAKLNPEDTFETELYNFDGNGLIYVAINAIKELDSKFTKFTFDNAGDLVLDNSGVVYSGVLNGQTNPVTAILAGAQGFFGKIKTKLVETTNLTAEKIITNKIEVNETVASPTIITDQIKIKDVDLSVNNSQNQPIIKFSEDKTVSMFGKLLIKDENNQTTTSIDNQGNATFSGELTVNELVADSARIKTLKAESIQGLEAFIASVSAQRISTNVVANDSEGPSQEDSSPAEPVQNDGWLADLNSLSESWSVSSSNHIKIESDLTVLGRTSLAQTVISGPLTQDGTLIFDEGNSINVAGGTLYLQNNGGGIDLLAGKVTIDSLGNAIFSGDLTVKGTLYANNVNTGGENLTVVLGSNTAGETAPESDVGQTSGFGKLIAMGNDDETVFSLDASGSAQFAGDISTEGSARVTQLNIARNIDGTDQLVNGILETTASAGNAIIPTGETEVTIKSPFVTENSLIYLTPKGSTNNKVVYLKETDPTNKTFTIAIDQQITSDVNFNWWIIN